MIKINLVTKCLVAFATIAMLSSCNGDNTVTQNTLTEKEQKEGWQLLFDGKNISHWHIYNQGSEHSAWVIRNEELYCDPESNAQKGDLLSNKEYSDYELRFEWKLEKEGNSGVFVNVQEKEDIPQTWQSGPEYQLLEDSHADMVNPLKRPGCLYTFTPQMNFVKTHHRSEWNQSKIIQKDGILSFYLNDVQTAEMDLNSKRWKDMVKTSNFKDYPEFGKHIKGKIALQDWSRGVSFRNIKIKEL